MTQLKWQLKWLALALLILAGLSGCIAPTRPIVAGAEQDEAQRAREARLATLAHWSFSGRVALSRGKEGGSGRIDWQQDGEDFYIVLAAPITHQSWRLQRQAGRARIDGIEGGSREGGDAEALLLQTTGWRIPVDALSKWVRGARATGTSQVEYDGNGLPVRITQNNWAIEFRAWDATDPPLPVKIFARQEDASVRLVIDRWGSP